MAGEGNNRSNVEASVTPFGGVKAHDTPYHSSETNNIQRRMAIHLYPITKMRLLVNYMIVVGRLVIPLFLAAYSAWLRNQRSVVDGLRRQLTHGIVAVVASSISLSTLSRAIAIPCGKIDPLLRTFRVIRETSKIQDRTSESQAPEKSVNCDVLHDPGTANVRADVIFIHGLHGSLEKTWRQGNWDATHAQTVPLRRNKCHSISKRGNPAMVSLRKQTTFIHTQEEVNGVPSDSVRKTSIPSEPEGQTDSTPQLSDAEVCRNVISNVDNIINGMISNENDSSDKADYSACWPRDWLPVDCPGVRVIALNYTTDPFLWRPVWVSKRLRTCMLERGREMMEHLQKLGVGNHPIVWVGHSKGGLFIKQLIVDAYESSNKVLSGICHNTKAIMFYSVPHHGSPCADINLPLLRKSVEVIEVERDCPTLIELHEQFISLINSKVLNADIFSFIETIQTFISIFYLQIVAFEAADPGVGEIWGVTLDHRDICKPTSRDCFLYKELANLINRAV